MKHTINLPIDKNGDDTLPPCRSPLICIILLVSAGLLLFLDILEINSYTYITPRLQLQMNQTHISKPDLHYLIKLNGCSIPYFDPFDMAVKKYVEKPPLIKCENTEHPLLLYTDVYRIYFNETTINAYGFNDTNLECCYKYFQRRKPKNNEADTKYNVSDECFPFKNGTKISYEFIKVACKNHNSTFSYEDVFNFIIPEKVIDKLVRKRTQKLLNILIIGVDAVSRLNLHRNMPETIKYLKEKMNARELLGYNKIGDNTFPNLMPLLTGLKEEDLKNSCLPNLKTSRFDNCPFIWKNFSDAGYVTAYGEDCTGIGLFNYVRNGFKEQSTDYDWRTFDRVSEKTIGHTKHLNCRLCLGGRFQYEVLLEYSEKFAKIFSSHPYFGFFWEVSLSHDFLNYPSLADKKYFNFFYELSTNGYLDNTVVFFISDHGIRWGGIRQTYQGRLEERLPFVFISLPKWFSDEYPSASINLMRNERRLTTPLDLHETFIDLLDLKRIEQKSLNRRIKSSLNDTKISLFLPIPENRTCESSRISDHWCTCQNSSVVSIKRKDVIEVGNFVVKHINNLLHGYTQCAILTLKDITSAFINMPSEHVLPEQKNTVIEDYTIVLKTDPSDALFEATVRRKAIKDNKFDLSIAGTISRINLYGSQSKCITDFHLKLYCFCQ